MRCPACGASQLVDGEGGDERLRLSRSTLKRRRRRTRVTGPEQPRIAYETTLGQAWHGDSLQFLDTLEDNSVNLVVTSPPFALVRQKAYGNEPEEEYVSWFHKFAEAVKTKLTDDGSFVIDLGGAWLPGTPTRSLYQYRLLLDLVDHLDYRLAEDFYWFNRAKLPGPRQWVNIERTRVKDAVNLIWWMSKTDSPKADNRRVLRPYSKSMERMIKRGTYNEGARPSQHDIGKTWANDQGGAIAPNVLELDLPEWMFGGEPDNMLDYANTVSGDPYLRYCRDNGITAHPARFPRQVPEFFVKFLTEPGDLVVDIFAGSNMTGAAAEAHGRRWASCDLDGSYVAGSLGRFHHADVTITEAGVDLGMPHGELSAGRVDSCSDRCCQAKVSPDG